MSAPAACQWCGEPISPRTDPHEWCAPFCSTACRAAAHRAGEHAENAAEITQADHSGASIIRHHGNTPQTLAPVVAAALELTQATTDTSLPEGPIDA